MKILRTASLGSNFAGSYKKKSVAGGRIRRTRKTDLASKLRHELSGDVTNHRVTHKI